MSRGYYGAGACTTSRPVHVSSAQISRRAARSDLLKVPRVPRRRHSCLRRLAVTSEESIEESIEESSEAQRPALRTHARKRSDRSSTSQSPRAAIMSLHAILALLLGASLTLVASQDASLLLQNRKIVDRQIGCILQRNSCDIIGKQIKALLPEALNNNCMRCTNQQKINASKLMAFMEQYYPTEWELIQMKYSKLRRFA